jgi:hypothetical protein
MSLKNLKNKNPYHEIKAKILNMEYNKDNNLFNILFEDLDNKKQASLAIRGTDWGITPDVPDDMIEKFCQDMIGKEKNLHIEVDNSSLRDAKKDDKGITSQEEINRIFDTLKDYPIDEVANIIHEKELDSDED